MSKQKRKLFMP